MQLPSVDARGRGVRWGGFCSSTIQYGWGSEEERREAQKKIHIQREEYTEANVAPTLERPTL